jgi:hypothetical protein
VNLPDCISIHQLWWGPPYVSKTLCAERTAVPDWAALAALWRTDRAAALAQYAANRLCVIVGLTVTTAGGLDTYTIWVPELAAGGQVRVGTDPIPVGPEGIALVEVKEQTYTLIEAASKPSLAEAAVEAGSRLSGSRDKDKTK